MSNQTEEQSARRWKTIAIIFIALFISLLLYVLWGVYLYYSELNATKDCYYNLCKEYADAEYYDKVCYCYDYDVLGDLIVVETFYDN